MKYCVVYEAGHQVSNQSECNQYVNTSMKESLDYHRRLSVDIKHFRNFFRNFLYCKIFEFFLGFHPRSCQYDMV